MTNTYNRRLGNDATVAAIASHQQRHFEADDVEVNISRHHPATITCKQHAITHHIPLDTRSTRLFSNVTAQKLV